MNPESKQSATLIKQLLEAFDKTISSKVWRKSLFLSAILTKIKELRAKVINLLASYEGKQASQGEISQSNSNQKDNPHIKPVYIYLYNVDGDNLRKWEKLLVNIDKQAITRPIYSHKEDVLKVIQANKSLSRKNEAYIIAQLNEQDILYNDNNKASCDKLGHELISIKDKALNASHVQCFCHVSGSYRFLNGKLVLFEPKH